MEYIYLIVSSSNASGHGYEPYSNAPVAAYREREKADDRVVELQKLAGGWTKYEVKPVVLL